MRYYDAHLHLQDTRLAPHRSRLLEGLRASGVERLVTNGTHPDDWDAVAELAAAHPGWIWPAYGVHPWRVGQEPAGWEAPLRARLEADPRASVGEIGLDKWIEGHDLERQQQVFRRQLEIACEFARPVTIHCLHAWGPLLETLQAFGELPPGVLLHSPGASAEVVRQLAEMGCYFSVSGYFGDMRKKKYREALAAFPLDRLLIETDAPDMLGPDACCAEQISDEAGQPLNSPLNLPQIYAMVAEARGLRLKALALQVEENFSRWIGMY